MQGAGADSVLASIPRDGDPLRILVAALREPSCYSHPATAIEVIETHISVVVLAGEFAYKLKKPVDLGFLDFRTLAARSIEEAPESGGWLAPLKAWTPSAIAARQERDLRDRVTASIAALPADGGLQRVLAMRVMRGLPASGLLTDCPALVLWGSKERHTLDMEGPGTGRLCRPDLAYRVLPAAEVHWVWDEDGQAVPHASTLRHHAAFNVHLERFLARLARSHTGVRSRVANLIPFRPRTTEVASA